ncbi:unnamed protein product, partial [marine sediment metagenome]
MKCHFCHKKAVIKDIDKFYCKNCFARVIEKRVRKYLRINKVIRKNDKLLVFDNVSLWFLKKIIKDPSIKIVFKKLKPELSKVFENKKIKTLAKSKKANKIVLPWTADDEISLFLKAIFSNKKPKNLGQIQSYVKLFKVITEQELVMFSKIKKLGYKEKKKTDINQMI